MTSQTGSIRRRFTTAFTLLETLIVLAILALFFGVSLPLFSRLTSSAKLDTSARSVASALNTARSLAISKNIDYYVFFAASTTTQDTYYITSDAAGATGIEEKIYKLPTGVRFGANGFTLVAANTYRAQFTSTGSLNADSETSVALSDGTYTKTVSVENTTGRVRIQ